MFIIIGLLLNFVQLSHHFEVVIILEEALVLNLRPQMYDRGCPTVLNFFF